MFKYLYKLKYINFLIKLFCLFNKSNKHAQYRLLTENLGVLCTH